VSSAVDLQRRLESPKYRQTIWVAEALLKDHPEILRSGETSIGVLLEFMKAMTLTYNRSDITQLVSKYLHERGIKVWR
jgi:hypothetical protein